jgi:hypothetical protein
MPELKLRPGVSGLAHAIAWLDDHDVPTSRISGLLKIKENHVRQLAFRGRYASPKLRVPAVLEDSFRPPSDPLGPVSDSVRHRLGLRSEMESWALKFVPLGTSKNEALGEFEAQVENLGATFWQGVRYGAGIDSLRLLRAHIGRPAHFRRIRLLARVQQLIAETYAHVGYSLSAVEFGLAAMLLSRAAYQDSGDSIDLKQFATTALIVSQAHLLRQEPDKAAWALRLYKSAHKRINLPLGAEYFRQRGAVVFQSGPLFDETARKYFKRAARKLSETVEYGHAKQPYEVLNIGQRHMNLLGPVDVDGSHQLLDFMLKTLSPGELPISMTLNWAAACGFSTDSPPANQSASELLERNHDASIGFGHQATVAWLLSLSPDLPLKLRPAWVRLALYENSFRNR